MTAGRAAADAFALLSDESRVNILRAVAMAQYEQAPSNAGFEPLSFSEIYDRVDVDNTSKLSYHLGELTGTYLRKHDGGYSFTHAGDRIVRFILAENFRRPADIGSIETSGTCLYCGETTLEARLDEQYFVVRCPTCDRPVTGYTLTPAQARARSGETLLESLKRKQGMEFGLVQAEICPECAGRMDAAVHSVEELTPLEDVPVSHFTLHDCESCRRRYSGPLPFAAAFRTASIAFYWERGVDLLGTGWWECYRFLRDGCWTSERVGSDPVEYRVVLRHEDAELRLVLDDDARTVRTERVRTRSGDRSST
ncbi:ArsR family transcriptional regulator [Salinadaptatus halalkaliphilus]|uniref:ArsR family transcriptional regulator n=1 Tax=Salinadaptatus halalkaliphilus TaxID=2419781 RepID=A0A4S3TN51_9EURY|nr:helix-turn-helix domain-containing protein [Salinadaptatus halalkaliphilus]THE65682.1 ArsR family transcriptional regulator [Salinadaptatus halalkaliphilus]